MAGRLASYLHSDSITENKGCAVVKVTCQTDFAARTQEFIAFCNLVARRAYGASAETWKDVENMFPEMETERQKLCKVLREDVVVADIVTMSL